ncbi:MAG: hypothetical protein ABI718_09755 [Acidobacteriota bacterium]
MAELIDFFAAPLTGRDGRQYVVRLHGNDRPDGRWEARLEFASLDGMVTAFSPVETTQDSRAAIADWARGLGPAFFTGALDRALQANSPTRPPVVPDGTFDNTMSRRDRAGRIGDKVIDYFRRRRVHRIPTSELFDILPYSNADIVRSLEDLERKHRLLVRMTDEGTDWIVLTADGAREAGLDMSQFVVTPAPTDPKALP